MNEDSPVAHKGSSRVRDLGLLAGPVGALLVYVALGSSPGLAHEARALAAVCTLMATWWVSEAIPLAVTALVPIVAFPVLGVLPLPQACAPYAHKLIFLFMGGLMLGAGLERWGAHKRLALLIILCVGTAPRRIVGGVMLAAALLSAFVSNTATAMMLLPIVVSVGALATQQSDDERASARFQVCLLLALAYGCSIGGVATLMGTPPNAFMAGFVKQELDMDMTYARWLRLGVPFVAVMLPLSWAYMVHVAIRVRIGQIPGGRAMIRARLRELGPMRAPELVSVSIFALTALAWITHGLIESALDLPPVDDAMIAIAGAMLMFMAPVDRTGRTRVLDWAHAQRIPWGVLLLFGGGLALAQGFGSTGLDAWFGMQFARMGNPGELPVVGGAAVLIVFLTEMTSNTATTSTMLPVMLALSEGLGMAPMSLILAATLSASCAFMLPVATPPNAIVFASGRVTIRDMALTGLGLNLISVVVITLVAWGAAPTLLGLGDARSAPQSEQRPEPQPTQQIP